MGLASKIAASQPTGGAPGPAPYGQPSPTPYGQAQPPPGQYGAYPQGQGGYQPQQQQQQRYQAHVNPNFYPTYPQSAYPYPPQGQPQPYGSTPYGQAPQQPYNPQPFSASQQSYGASSAPSAPSGPSGPPPDANVLLTILKEAVKEKRIEHMYPEPRLLAMAQDLARKDPVNTLCNHWKLPKEVGFDFVKLALFDVVFLLDDSGSMRFGDGLIDELKFILGSVAFATALFDQDGFSVRFMNSSIQQDNIRTEKEAMDLVDRVRFEDVTPLATSLKNKILDPLVYGADRAGTLKKPFLVIIITDGRPTDNVHGEFQSHIRTINDHFQGRGVVSFQIAQVGNDKGAQEFLLQLDRDKAIGGLIDCTSNFEMEYSEWTAKGLTLTKHLWYTKLLLGSIDKSYDNKDEDTKGDTLQSYGGTAPSSSYGGPAPFSYGAPPSQQYGAPSQPQTGAPQQQSYGAPQQPYGAPQQPQHGQMPASLQAGNYNAPGGPQSQRPGSYEQPQPYGSQGGYPPQQNQGGYPQSAGAYNPSRPPPPNTYTPNAQYNAPPQPQK